MQAAATADGRLLYWPKGGYVRCILALTRVGKCCNIQQFIAIAIKEVVKMARKVHVKDERTFGRHEARAVRRLKTADYLVNVDYNNWASSVMAVALLLLTDDLSVGLVTSGDDGLYPADATKRKDDVATATNYDVPKKVVVELNRKSIGCGVSDYLSDHYDYHRELCARERLLGDTGLVLLRLYCDILCRQMGLKAASVIYDRLSDLVEPVDNWQLSKIEDGLVAVINSFYPITQMNETFSGQFIAAVKLVQELLPRAISRARAELTISQLKRADASVAEGGVE